MHIAICMEKAACFFLGWIFIYFSGGIVYPIRMRKHQKYELRFTYKGMKTVQGKGCIDKM